MLRTALTDNGATPPLRFVAPAAAAPDIARKMVERYGASLAARKPASALEALLRRLRRARYDRDKIAPSDRLDVVFVLWESATPPAEHPEFLARFLDWVATPWRRLQAARLAACWAAAFDPRLTSIRTVAAFLARHAEHLPEPWPRLAAKFSIFSVEQAPEALAEACLAEGEPISSALSRLRLPDAAATGGLALETLAVAAMRVEQGVAADDWLAERLCGLARHGEGLLPDVIGGRLIPRAGVVRRAVAEALLLAWQGAESPQAVKTPALAFLLRHYGDPRITRHPWGELRAPAASIMRRWATEASVTLYFQLLARTPSVDRAALAERAQFWRSRLGQIDDAWLVCGPRHRAALGPDQPAHGALAGCRPDQSALILRLGPLTIVEASHAASESIWLAGNPFAPRSYQPPEQPYWPAALAKSADFASAVGTKGGRSWQERLADFVARHL
jgi:hypothetical protein